MRGDDENTVDGNVGGNEHKAKREAFRAAGEARDAVDEVRATVDHLVA